MAKQFQAVPRCVCAHVRTERFGLSADSPADLINLKSSSLMRSLREVRGAMPTDVCPLYVSKGKSIKGWWSNTQTVPVICKLIEWSEDNQALGMPLVMDMTHLRALLKGLFNFYQHGLVTLNHSGCGSFARIKKIVYFRVSRMVESEVFRLAMSLFCRSGKGSGFPGVSLRIFA